MAATWSHPTLGTFKFKDGIAWSKIIAMPAFQSFAYDEGYSDSRKSDGMHELSFEADDKDDLPSPEAVALADKALANQAKLVTKVTKALWEDFNGRGPGSGMWWHGKLDDVADAMGEDEPPSCAEDLLALLQVECLTIRKEIDGHEGPLVELSFQAAFEGEHGVSALTDGDNILGLGYMTDATLFGAMDDEPEPRDRSTISAIEQLEHAIVNDDEKDIDRLLASGIDLNAVGPGESAPLCVAVGAMKPGVVRRLLEAGADVSLRDPNDQITPLQFAKQMYRQMGFGSKKKSNDPYSVFADQKAVLDEIIALLEAASAKK